MKRQSSLDHNVLKHVSNFQDAQFTITTSIRYPCSKNKSEKKSFMTAVNSRNTIIQAEVCDKV